MIKLHLFQLVTSNAQPTSCIRSSFGVRIQCLENSFLFFKEMIGFPGAQTIVDRPAMQDISV